MTITHAAICFIACHTAPGEHFADFSQTLQNPEVHIEIYASDPAYKKFQERKVEVTRNFSLDTLSSEEETALAIEIAKSCTAADIVITDVGHTFAGKIQEALAIHTPKAVRIAYYDNPESYVPGGYSAVAAQIMQKAQTILFANANLATQPIYETAKQEIDLGAQEKIGVGYYPLHQADLIANRREKEQTSMREKFFLQHDIIDTGQNILIYFGGNNEEYFTKAFPAFLSLLKQASEKEDLSPTIVVLQQHPGALAKNIDGTMFANLKQEQHTGHNLPKMIVSDIKNDEAQILADAALYYQTSMAAQFVLAGIPTIQIGHNVYEDTVIKNKAAQSVITDTELLQALESLKTEEQQSTSFYRKTLLKGLGYDPNWQKTLQEAIEKKVLSTAQSL